MCNLGEILRNKSLTVVLLDFDSFELIDVVRNEHKCMLLNFSHNLKYQTM